MKKQLEVSKSDGTTEEYLHTKVIGAINNALAASGRPDMAMAEDLAEVVTYYLYKQKGRRRVGSNDILSMIKAVLVSTGHGAAAMALGEHALERRLHRARIEVLDMDVRDFRDVERLFRTSDLAQRMPWSKGRIVRELTDESGLSPQIARAVAAMVEERVFNMGMTVIPRSLVRQLVLGEAATALRAEHELHTA
jgi:hypothetical protein